MRRNGQYSSTKLNAKVQKKKSHAYVSITTHVLQGSVLSKCAVYHGNQLDRKLVFDGKNPHRDAKSVAPHKVLDSAQCILG